MFCLFCSVYLNDKIVNFLIALGTIRNAKITKRERSMCFTKTNFIVKKMADRAAKNAASAPLIMDDVIEKLDLQRYIGRKFEEKLRKEIYNTPISSTLLLALN
ncbi:uncharacterized protein ACN2A1_013449 [Glossina fuscipes fuscipes]